MSKQGKETNLPQKQKQRRKYELNYQTNMIPQVFKRILGNIQTVPTGHLVRV